MRSKLGKILCAEANSQVLSAQVSMFNKAGYAVVPALGRATVEVALAQSAFDVVVFGHTLTKDDRHHLPYVAKKANPATRVLVLHASGKHPKVDLALDSRLGEAVVLEAVAQLMGLDNSRKISPRIAAAVAYGVRA